MNSMLGGAALALVALSAAPSASAAPAARGRATAAPEAPAVAAPDGPSAPARGLRGEVNAIPLFALGILPSPALGVSPHLGFRWPGLSLGVEARFLAGLDRTPVTNEVRTNTTILMAVPSVCGHRGPLFACGAIGVGQLRATGPRSQGVGTGDPWMATLGLRGGLEGYVAPRFALRAFAEGAMVLGRPSVKIDGVDRWTAPGLAVVLGLGFMIPLGGAGPY